VTTDDVRPIHDSATDGGCSFAVPPPFASTGHQLNVKTAPISNVTLSEKYGLGVDRCIKAKEDSKKDKIEKKIDKKRQNKLSLL
jgi:hypothetical protein